MSVRELHALQNGFIGFERSGLFYGERSSERVQIPIACWLIRTSDAVILFDTGLSPRAVPGLMRNDPMARFTEEDLLVHRLERLGLEPDHVDLVVISHLHFDHAGGAQLFPKSELLVQKDEYAYANYPATFFESFYYRKNFDLPGYRWRLLDGDTELLPGVTALRTDGHTLGATIFFGAVVYVLWTRPIPRARRWVGTVAAALLALGVAYSRLYLRAHWASDVAGGLTGGGAYVLLVLAGVERSLRPAPSDTRRDTA